jgi:hypothetical protein
MFIRTVADLSTCNRYEIGKGPVSQPCALYNEALAAEPCVARRDGAHAPDRHNSDIWLS